MKYALEDLGIDEFRAAFARAFEEHKARAAAVAPPEQVAPLAPAQVAEVLARIPPQGWSSGVRPERTPGHATITVHLPLGDLTPDEARALADLAQGFGDGVVHLTRNQNLALRGVALADVPSVRSRLADFGLSVEGSDDARDVRSCTGAAVCSLGITAAPEAGSGLRARPSLARNTSLRVHVSGCPNSCAQHQAADIGLSGAKVRINGETRLGYHLWLGADIARGRLAVDLGRAAETDIDSVVDAVIGVWEALRHKGEVLGSTVERVGGEAFAAHIARVAHGFVPGPDPDEVDSPVASPVAASAVPSTTRPVSGARPHPMLSSSDHAGRSRQPQLVP